MKESARKSVLYDYLDILVNGAFYRFFRNYNISYRPINTFPIYGRTIMAVYKLNNVGFKIQYRNAK